MVSDSAVASVSNSAPADSPIFGVTAHKMLPLRYSEQDGELQSEVHLGVSKL